LQRILFLFTYVKAEYSGTLANIHIFQK